MFLLSIMTGMFLQLNFALTLVFESTPNINAEQKFPSFLLVVRPDDGSAGEDR